jgi:hypothetical protein
LTSRIYEVWSSQDAFLEVRQQIQKCAEKKSSAVDADRVPGPGRRLDVPKAPSQAA